MTQLNGVKLVIWDLDGTLIDSYGVYAAILKEAAELSGLAMPDEQTLRHNFHGSLDQTLKDSLNMVDGEAFTKLLNDFLTVQENYYQKPEEHLHLDALRLAEQLTAKQVYQVVVTNRAHVGRGNASPRRLVSLSSLKNHINEIICGDDTTYGKPDARVLDALEQASGLQGSEIVVIGDQFVDAQLAQNLGGQAIIVNRGDEPVPHLAELGDDTPFLEVVSSLDEVSVK
ncbi:MAG: putative phosphoglycolate phosphatase [Candidatus Saccharibacteria bacterium]|nr:putative phosphoglycolate phosphatase [Candidatus Saccharibacteria bacterium]